MGEGREPIEPAPPAGARGPVGGSAGQPAKAGDGKGDDADAAHQAKKKAEAETPAQPAPPKADPDIQLAFRLGWHVAELYGDPLREKAGGKAKLAHTLPGISDLSEHERAEVTLRTVRAELHLLAKPCKPAGVKLPSSHKVEERFQRPGRSRDEVRAEILRLHKALLRDLTAADFRLGKAYGLGRALADTTLRPGTRSVKAYKKEFGPHRVRTICDWLDDLASAFPAHAAPAVRLGLGAWSAWVAAPTIDGSSVDLADGDERLTRTLRDQGRLWRSLLSGEKRPEDLLTASHYVEAAKGLIRRTSSLAWKFVASWAGVIVLGLLAIAVMLLALTTTTGGARTIAAIAAAATALGLTWKTVGSTLGKGLERAEQPLWQAELAAAIATAATWVPTSVKHFGPWSPPEETEPADATARAASRGT